MPKRIYIDFETRSACPLKSEGAWKYSKHHTTDVLCIAYAFDDGPTQLILGNPTINGMDVPTDLWDALRSSDCEIWAHNVAFERGIWENVLTPRYGWPEIDPSRWRCSMALCGRWGLPQSLDMAARALRLKVKKDKIGHALMMKMCKPRKVKKSSKIHWWDKPADLERLGEYCKTDVDVERLIVKKLPPMEPEELAIWQWTEEVNHRGIRTDQKLVSCILDVLAILDKRDLEEFRKLTEGTVDSPRQVQALRDWIEIETGHVMDDLRAATVRDALKSEDLPKRAKKALEYRQNLSKSSLAKFTAFRDRADNDDQRLRGHLRYAGAHTGRWAGQGAQLQNLPSRSDTIGKIEVAQSVDAFLTGDADYCETVLTNSRDAASLAVRRVLYAPQGKILVAADFASIEARGLLWLADAEQLRIIKDRRNLYIEMAQRISKKPVDKEKDPFEYALGKQAILGLGYGMGATKFQATCAGYDIHISLDFADRVKTDYREWIIAVPKLWYDAENAFFRALQTGSASFARGRVKLEYAQSTLRCTLPSGRKMIYWYPTIRPTEAPWDEFYMIDQIHYLSTGRWTHTYGGKIVENIVQAMCRDLLRDAALRIWRQHPEYKAVLTVHDELVFEVDENKADLDMIIRTMCEVPPWAEGMPIAAEGWIAERFRK